MKVIIFVGFVMVGWCVGEGGELVEVGMFFVSSLIEVCVEV